MAKRDVTSWLPNLIGPIDFQINGVEQATPKRTTVNLITTGATCALADDQSNDRTNLTITVAGGAPPTGTGFRHVTSNTEDGAVRAIDMSTADVTGILPSSHVIGRTCSLRQFGAVGGGVADDSAAMTAAIAALTAGTYSTLFLDAGTYLIASGGPYTLPAGCSIIGAGKYSTILKTTGNHGVLLVGGDFCHFSDFRIVGDDPSPNTLNHRAQYGIANGLTGAGNSYSHVTVTNVDVRDVGGNGFQFYRLSTYDARLGMTWENCSVDNSWTGWLVAEQGEYAVLNGCTAIFNNLQNAYFAAGNFQCNGCNFSLSNNYNVFVDGPFTNDSHGLFSGCTFNHGNPCVNVGAIANGLTFDGCHIISGGVTLTGSVGVQFNGCEMNGGGFTYTFAGSTGTSFNGCLWYGADPTISETSNPTTYFSTDNRKIDGTVPVWIAARQQALITFASDANQALTSQQSQAQRLTVAPGTITVTRKLTSTRAPTLATPTVTIWNQNTQSIQFAWSSGTAATIAPNAVMTISADGTNAVAVTDTDAGARDFCLDNNQAYRQRNTAGAVSDVARFNNGNNLIFGDATNTANTVVGASTGVFPARVGGSDYIACTASTVAFGQPVVGNSTPYAGLNGTFSKTLTAAQSYDPASSEYCFTDLEFVSNGANIVRLPPATNAQTYFKFVQNVSGGGTIAVKDTSNNAAAATLASGTGAWFRWSSGAVKQVTAAFTVA